MGRKKILSLILVALILTSGAIAVWIINESKDDFMVVNSYAEVSKDHFTGGEAVPIAVWPNSTNYAFRVNVNLGIFKIPDVVGPLSILNDSNLRSEIKNHDVNNNGLHGEVNVKDFTNNGGIRSTVWNGTVLAKGLLLNITSNKPVYVNAPAGYYFVYPLDNDYYDYSEKHSVDFELTESSIFYYGGLDLNVSHTITGGSADYEVLVANNQSTAQTVQCHIEGRIYASDEGDKISEDFVLAPGNYAKYHMSCALPSSGQVLSVMVLIRTSVGDYYIGETIYGTGLPSWGASS